MGMVHDITVNELIEKLNEFKQQHPYGGDICVLVVKNQEEYSMGVEVIFTDDGEEGFCLIRAK